ncbi:mitochondrial ribosomal protein of the large subunit [Myxozyma melibiosi]|uniref:Mitochondrial ribosomal protein of the large subunit n=1 Tax=Myxozyma melibiosi TaxID=54550 RepID=A0ABR1F4G4_9ASCO
MKLPSMSPAAKAVFERMPAQLSKFFLRYPPRTIQKYAEKPVPIDDPTRNPFLPAFNPATKKYREPVYSLRQQSVLYKLAEEYGVRKLLPFMTKKFGLHKQAQKKKMKRSKNPKGHKYDNTKEERAAKRAEAIRQMDEIVAKVKGKRYQRRIAAKSKLPKHLF